MRVCICCATPFLSSELIPIGRALQERWVCGLREEEGGVLRDMVPVIYTAWPAAIVSFGYLQTDAW